MKHRYIPKFFFAFFLVILNVTGIHAQVTGTVTDSLNQPLPFCNVMLLRAADSTVVTGTTCSETGAFLLEKKESGSFRLMIMYSGYEKKYTDIFTLAENEPSYAFGTVVLMPDATMLKAVQIVAQKPFMEQKLDRTVFNIENSILATGNTALDVLRKLPGVTVDNNDNISVRGKQGVQFMIDGRRSYMGGSDMANYLRGIDASQIEKIEVITNPSAKYEASGNAIINIVMKRNRNLGYNQQLNASYEQGFYGGGNVGTNFNYKTQKWNFFGAANVGQWQFYEEFERTIVYNPDSASHASSIANGRPKMGGMWDWEQAGIDYSPGKRHTIGIVAERSGGTHDVTRRFDMSSYSSEMVLDSNLYTTGLEQSNNQYYSGALNYKFDIDTTGKLLTADFNYANFTTHQNRENTTAYRNGAWQVMHDPLTQISDIDLTVGYATGQIDYVHPLKNENGLLEGGVRASSAKTTSAALYFMHQGGNWIQHMDRPIEFVYTEIISAAYLNYSRAINKKLDAQFGLRAEETMSKGEDGNSAELFNRQYLRLFPSAFLNWKIDSLYAINVSYSRRIERPDYGELNPFVIYSDPYTSFSGNPNLMPQMNHKVEVAHIFKGTYRTALSYMHMTSVFNGIVSVNDSTRVVNTRLENLATYNVFTLEFSAEYSFTNWYTLSATVLAFRDHYFGPVNGEQYSVVYYTGMLFLQNRISLKHDWGIEANFFGRSVNMNGIWRESPFSGVDIGVRKRFADGRGSVSLNLQDLLRGNYMDRTANYGNVNMSTTGQMDSRRV
ncbi:MAG TPA: TonB-dependent receptor, partial [Bacteroidia bacterium]|nr:TonB-dependent receptor [Bacteroidia bacterium]